MQVQFAAQGYPRDFNFPAADSRSVLDMLLLLELLFYLAVNADGGVPNGFRVAPEPDR